MLDHVEKIFADMKPMMKKLKKASYKVNMEAFIENHGHYFREMTEYTENASDKETAAKDSGGLQGGNAQDREHQPQALQAGRRPVYRPHL